MARLLIGNVKGPQGDDFTYEDFTEEQIAALKGDTGAAGADGATAAEVIAALSTETWTFTLANGSTVTKVVPLV